LRATLLIRISSTPSSKNSHFCSQRRYKMSWKALTRMIPLTVVHFLPKSYLPIGRSRARSEENERIEVKDTNS